MQALSNFIALNVPLTHKAKHVTSTAGKLQGIFMKENYCLSRVLLRYNAVLYVFSFCTYYLSLL